MGDMVSITDIQSARRRLEGTVHLTPCVRTVHLSHMAGCEIIEAMVDQGYRAK